MPPKMTMGSTETPAVKSWIQKGKHAVTDKTRKSS